MANVLVVDDSLTMRKSLTAILIEAGHTVVAQAANGFQACMEFERFHPDFVTMDIDMPFMNGIEALKSIIKSHPKANVLMVAHANSSLIYEAINAGAKGYVMKPFYIQEFINILNSTLQLENSITSISLERIYSEIGSL